VEVAVQQAGDQALAGNDLGYRFITLPDCGGKLASPEAFRFFLGEADFGPSFVRLGLEFGKGSLCLCHCGAACIGAAYYRVEGFVWVCVSGLRGRG
jgi:hypothetical protein